MFNAATQICKTVDDLVPVPVDILRDVLGPSPKIKTIEKSGAAAQTTAGAFLQTQIVMASNNINILFMQCKNADSKDLNEENVQFLGMFISNTSLMWEIGQVIFSLLCGLAAFLGSRWKNHSKINSSVAFQLPLQLQTAQCLRGNFKGDHSK